MRNAKQCGCSFSQSNSCMAGERIRVNSASSCGCDRNHYRCQESRRPKPCTPPTNPCGPCQPKPRPRPDCEDRCATQYRNCLRSCRRDHQDDCDCRYQNQGCFDDFDSCYGPLYDYDYNDCGCSRNRCRNNHHDCDDDCDDK